jgi:hypothetical protein
MPFAPRPRLWPVADRSAGAHPLSLSGRSPLPDAAFHSPAAIPSLAARPRSRVAVPGLHLQSDPAVFPGPVRYRAPAPARPFVALQGAFPATAPVARFQLRNSPSVFKLSLPFGTFQSLGIVALCLIPADETCLCRLPDLPSLPVFARPINKPSYDGSTFQIRYFLPSSLSFEPLGTTFIMHPNRTGVNGKMKVSSG